MAVNIKRKSGGRMAEVVLYRFDIVAAAQRGGRVGMPLRYDYDKPEKPCIARVTGLFLMFQRGGFPLLFPLRARRERKTAVRALVRGLTAGEGKTNESDSGVDNGSALGDNGHKEALP